MISAIVTVLLWIILVILGLIVLATVLEGYRALRRVNEQAALAAKQRTEVINL